MVFGCRVRPLRLHPCWSRLSYRRRSCSFCPVSFPTVPTLPCALVSFPFPSVRPKCMRSLLIYVSPRCRCQVSVRTYICFALLRCSALRQGFPPCLLWRLLTSHSSLLLRLMGPPVRPHGISRQSFLVYLPDLRLRVTVAFWTSLSLASLSASHALIPGSCSSGYDFAIPSSCLHLTM